jgi:hypothetical protein
MGLFSRRQHSAATADATTTARTTRRREKRAPIVMDMNRRPSFGQWLKVTWLDIVTMAAMGIIGLGVYEAHPAPSRSFPVYFQDGEIVYPQFAYPMRKEIVPICMHIKAFCQCGRGKLTVKRGRCTAWIACTYCRYSHLPNTNPQLLGRQQCRHRPPLLFNHSCRLPSFSQMAHRRPSTPLPHCLQALHPRNHRPRNRQRSPPNNV